jgi:hypothetical protein
MVGMCTAANFQIVPPSSILEIELLFKNHNQNINQRFRTTSFEAERFHAYQPFVQSRLYLTPTLNLLFGEKYLKLVPPTHCSPKD